MKIALVGPELEENLALRYIHAALARAGHEVRIYDFHEARQTEPVAAAIARWRPEIVGMSMVFTARARQFVALAEALRRRGFSGHVTAGGHFASFHAEPLLRDVAAIDSVLHGEGEEAMVELAANLDRPRRVRGMSRRTGGGSIVTTPPRAPLDDLDRRPWPTRPEVFHEYFGLPMAAMLSGRGCYANCAFCSIRAWHRKLGGRRFRQRSVEDVVAEMAHLYHDRGVRIFNFHDDNFFLPDAAANLRRFEAIRAALAAAGVTGIGFQVKARPDNVEPEVMDLLKEMGLFRVFLGVESNAVAGLKALGRGIRREQNHRALRIIRRRDVHVTFNLLMFEPECSPSDLRDNVDFIRRYPELPLNFCRVEVYAGTAIERRLRAAGRLEGDYFGYTYRLSDPRCQLAYEIFRDVFTPRNFLLQGMNLQAMAVDYNLHLLLRFFPRRVSGGLRRRCEGFIRDLNRSNAELLEDVLDFSTAGDPPPRAQVADFTRDMTDRRAQFDAAMIGRADALIDEIRALGAGAARPPRRPRAKAASAAAASLMVATLGAAQPLTPPCEPVHEPPLPPPTQPVVPLTTRPLAASAPTTASAPAGRATTTRPATKPAPKPYTAKQARKVQEYVQKHYRSAVRQLAATYRAADILVPMDLTLDAAGQVVSVRVRLPARQHARFARALETAARKWEVPGVPRAGACRIVLHTFYSPTDRDRITEPFEMAPVETPEPPDRALEP